MSNDIHIEIYADEVKYNKNDKCKEKFMYLGIVIIETSKKEIILKKINSIRKDIWYSNELHFTWLKNLPWLWKENKKTLLAEKYIDLILEDKDKKYFYFDILWINLENLDLTYFWNDKWWHYCNIYNRFFRTIVTRSINSYFDWKNVIIDNIFHDNENSLIWHQYFDWHLLYKLNWTINWKINFIDSNHNKESLYPNESHFIQIIDLLLWAMRQLYDNPNKKRWCKYIWDKIKPLIERMRDKPWNYNSKYWYIKKYNISFFPNSKDNILLLKKEDEKLFLNKFYIYREFVNNSQLSLF